MWLSRIMRRTFRRPEFPATHGTGTLLPTDETAGEDVSSASDDPKQLKPRDFLKPTTASLEPAIHLPAGAWNHMRRGHRSESMDDRWDVFVKDRRLVFARSWTKSPIVEIQIAGENELSIVAITWEGDSSQWQGGSAERAKELVGQVCQMVFGVILTD